MARGAHRVDGGRHQDLEQLPRPEARRERSDRPRADHPEQAAAQLLEVLEDRARCRHSSSRFCGASPASAAGFASGALGFGGAIGGSSSEAESVRVNSFEARRNSAMPRPSERAISGSFFGPSTSKRDDQDHEQLRHADAEHTFLHNRLAEGDARRGRRTSAVSKSGRRVARTLDAGCCPALSRTLHPPMKIRIVAGQQQPATGLRIRPTTRMQANFRDNFTCIAVRGRRKSPPGARAAPTRSGSSSRARRTSARRRPAVGSRVRRSPSTKSITAPIRSTPVSVQRVSERSSLRTTESSTFVPMQRRKSSSARAVSRHSS